MNTVRPTLTGTAQRASTLIGTPGTWSGIGNGYAYQWQRSTDGTTWADIAGATAHRLRAGRRRRRRDACACSSPPPTPTRTVTAASNPTATIPSAPPVNTVRPALTGTAARGVDADRHGRHLDRHRQQLAPTSGSARATTAPAGRASTARRARPTRSPTADVGAIVRVSVTTTNPERSATADQHRDRHRDRRRAGQHRRAGDLRHRAAHRRPDLDAGHAGAGAATRYGYQWQRSTDGTTWVDIAGATGAGYELAGADVGAKVRAARHRHQPGRRRAAAPAPRPSTVKAAPPVNTAPADRHRRDAAQHHAERLAGHAGAGRGSASPTSGSTTPAPGSPTSPGATGSTYLLGVADVGHDAAHPRHRHQRRRERHRHQPRVERRAGRAAVQHRARRRSPAPPGAPSTLTSTPGAWGGIENDYAYQWQRRTHGSAFTDIAGATGATYTLDSADVGAQIRLRVTATNLDGTASAYERGDRRPSSPAPPRNTGAPDHHAARRGSTTR